MINTGIQNKSILNVYTWTIQINYHIKNIELH